MAQRVAIVTGASSGVGRAVALRLVGQGWEIALVARRREALEEVISGEGGALRPRMHAYACDVADAAAVGTVVADLFRRFGGIHALVNSAGTNIPRRALDVLSLED